MKKLLSIALIATFVTPVFAQEKTYTCEGIYQQAAATAKFKRDRYNEKMNRMRGDLSNNDALTVLGLFAGLATGSTPVLLIGMLTPAAISQIKNLPTKEERALRLEAESSRQLARFQKRMQKQISPDVTKEEILSILQSGFDRGEFCKDIKNLAGPAKMRKFVKAQLRLKYSVPKKSLKDVIKGVFKKKGKADEICVDEDVKGQLSVDGDESDEGDDQE